MKPFSLNCNLDNLQNSESQTVTRKQFFAILENVKSQPRFSGASYYTLDDDGNAVVHAKAPIAELDDDGNAVLSFFYSGTISTASADLHDSELILRQWYGNGKMRLELTCCGYRFFSYDASVED